MGVGFNVWCEHLGHIREFLEVMRKAAFTLNLTKCEFAKSEVKFVGRVVGSGTHHPDPQRLEGLARIEPPRTKKELRKILGVFGYYREYIPHYSEIAQPMTDLTSSKVPNMLGDRWSIVRNHLNVCRLLSCRIVYCVFL